MFLTQGKTNWKYLLIVVIIATIVGGGVLWYVIQQEFPLVQLPKIKIPKKEEIIKKKLLLISGGFEEEYKAIVFDIETNQIESKKEINSTEMTINCWAGCNDPIQTSEDGETIVFYAGEAPLGLPCYECGPNLVSKLYLSPDELIFETNEDKQLFGQWVLRSDGKIIYVAIPRDRHADSPMVDLFEISILSHQAKKIVEDIGDIDAPLVLDKAQKNILSFFEKERIENNYHYYDIYSTEINLETKSVTKELVTRDDGDSFPFFSVRGLKGSPDLTKVVSLDQDISSSKEHYYIRVIDLKKRKDEEILTLIKFPNAEFSWSPDSKLLLFNLYRADLSQKGIWLYNFETQESQKPVRNLDPTGNIHLSFINGSFDGQRFLYQRLRFENDKVKEFKTYLFDITNNTEQLLPIDKPVSWAYWVE